MENQTKPFQISLIVACVFLFSALVVEFEVPVILLFIVSSIAYFIAMMTHSFIPPKQ